MLPCLDFPALVPPLLVPVADSCSRKFCHNSANVSLLFGLPTPSAPAKYSPWFSDGVLGVLCTVGAPGANPPPPPPPPRPPKPRRLPKLDVGAGAPDVVPGRARPACSRCSSVQPSRAAMSWRIWNFLGSERSRARKWRRWLVTICLCLARLLALVLGHGGLGPLAYAYSWQWQAGLGLGLGLGGLGVGWKWKAEGEEGGWCVDCWARATSEASDGLSLA